MNPFALLPVLFLLSAFFSASETALFSLHRDDLAWLRARGTRSAEVVLTLLERPRSLLTAVLFGNLFVNFLLIAVCARAVYELKVPGAWGLVLGWLVTTGAVVVLGEVIPKAVAVTAPRRVALLSSWPLLIFRNATRRITAPLGGLVSGLLERVEARLPAASHLALSDLELRRFVELHGQEGGIEREASQFLAEALELGSRRANEVMTPRVDLWALDLSAEDPRQDFLNLVRAKRVGKVVVHDGEGLDRIRGYLRTRDVLRAPETPLSELVLPIWFVPATKPIDSLLNEMIKREEPLALVVGEYGGTSGLVTLEDLIEEITGDIARQDQAALLQITRQGSWRMAGRFPLREVEELFGIRFAAPATTLSGFLAHALGEIPRPGAEVVLGGVSFRVQTVAGRRADQIEVRLPGALRRRAPEELSDPQHLTQSGAFRAVQRMQQWVEERMPEGEEPGAYELPPEAAPEAPAGEDE